ncbi:MAG: FprA family A-type flavoprotein [Candidatus Omnitrophica bacterium]|nr:FprA family A-type flavoprotein [Candidatus Omnitrophota bacterium]
MNPVEIKKDIYWVGGIDWDLRNFHGYSTERGSTYNAYLIVDDHITLVDTVKHYLFDEMLERICKVIDPAKIKYIISNHVEMDHSGSIPFLLERCPGATVITSPNGEKGLKMHYGPNMPLKVVNNGDELKIGKRSLKFVLMPMVHWPDSMATYIPEEKILLPNDAFGQHIASSERFDDEFPWEILKHEAAKYYANIVLPYGRQVNKALEAVKAIPVDIIGPSHGLILRSKISDMIKLYGDWANNVTARKAIVVYDTMWNSTKKIALAIHEAFLDSGINARLLNLETNHISDIMTEMLYAEYIAVGSPTLNNGLLPAVSAFLTYMKGLAPKNRKALAFGSYGWGGQSVDEIDKVLNDCGFQMLDKIKLQYVPLEGVLNDMKNKLKEVLK